MCTETREQCYPFLRLEIIFKYGSNISKHVQNAGTFDAEFIITSRF